MPCDGCLACSEFPTAIPKFRHVLIRFLFCIYHRRFSLSSFLVIIIIKFFAFFFWRRRGGGGFRFHDSFWSLSFLLLIIKIPIYFISFLFFFFGVGFLGFLYSTRAPHTMWVISYKCLDYINGVRYEFFKSHNQHLVTSQPSLSLPPPPAHSRPISRSKLHKFDAFTRYKSTTNHTHTHTERERERERERKSKVDN